MIYIQFYLVGIIRVMMIISDNEDDNQSNGDNNNDGGMTYEEVVVHDSGSDNNGEVITRSLTKIIKVMNVRTIMVRP